jgi:hypothetical protein
VFALNIDSLTQLMLTTVLLAFIAVLMIAPTAKRIVERSVAVMRRALAYLRKEPSDGTSTVITGDTTATAWDPFAQQLPHDEQDADDADGAAAAATAAIHRERRKSLPVFVAPVVDGALVRDRRKSLPGMHQPLLEGRNDDEFL